MHHKGKKTNITESMLEEIQEFKEFKFCVVAVAFVFKCNKIILHILMDGQCVISHL